MGGEWLEIGIRYIYGVIFVCDDRKLIQVDQWNTITLLENVLPLPYTLIWLQSVLNEDDSSESIFATDINKVCHSRKGTFHTEIHPILPQNCQTWHFFGL